MSCRITPISTTSGFLTVTDFNDFNGPAQTTNLGVRSSNLLWRAKLPPFGIKLRTRRHWSRADRCRMYAEQCAAALLVHIIEQAPGILAKCLQRLDRGKTPRQPDIEHTGAVRHSLR